MRYDRPLPVPLRPDLDHAREAAMRSIVRGPASLLPVISFGPMRERVLVAFIASRIEISTRSKVCWRSGFRNRCRKAADSHQDANIIPIIAMAHPTSQMIASQKRKSFRLRKDDVGGFLRD